MTTAPSTDLAFEVGAVIRDLMFRKRITVTRMGQAIGIQHATMGRKLRGLTAITVPELLMIAQVLDVDPGDLLPRLDSNQQPFGYESPQVRGVRGHLRLVAA